MFLTYCKNHKHQLTFSIYTFFLIDIYQKKISLMSVFFIHGRVYTLYMYYCLQATREADEVCTNTEACTLTSSHTDRRRD